MKYLGYGAKLLLRRLYAFKSAAIPAKLLLWQSSCDLQCCTTTRFTAAADSANCDRASAELFLVEKNILTLDCIFGKIESYFLILPGVSRGHQSWDF